MIEIKNGAFQGDIALIRRDKVPGSFKESVVQDEVIVAHSETGHHHVAVGKDLVYLTNPSNPMKAYLVAKGPVVVEHRRPTDTHEAYKLLYEDTEKEVVWEIRRQRESTPEGWKRVED